MIHVAIGCMKSRPVHGLFCAAIEDTVELADVQRWHAETLAKHAWSVDENGDTYCPKHNPADMGAVVTLTSGEYRPLGNSGWEARVPDGFTFEADIEIRQQRGDDDD